METDSPLTEIDRISVTESQISKTLRVGWVFLPYGLCSAAASLIAGRMQSPIKSIIEELDP
jgi:hypothetical protein